jgi:hypothetical protein
MASGQVIGVASEAAPGHWQPCARSNVVANAEWGSCGSGGGSVAEPHLAPTNTQNAFLARVVIFTQPATPAATDVTKHPRHVQTWKFSLSIGMWHVTVLCAIQVYQFFVMCQGIMPCMPCRGWTIGLMVAAVQRRSLTLSTWLSSSSRGVISISSDVMSLRSHSCAMVWIQGIKLVLLKFYVSC